MSINNSNPSVYIIILNWNGWEDTIDCLDSVFNSDYTNYKIILLDNNSQNNSVEKLKPWINKNAKIVDINEKFEDSVIIQKGEKIVFIKNADNLGFAKGNNIGIRYAQNQNSDYVFLLNNDTIIENDTLSKLVNFIELNPKYVAVSPQIRLFSKPEIIWNCGGKISRLGFRKYFFDGSHFSKIPKSKSIDISFVTGCALFYDYKTVGFLSENFFFGEEDFELSLRLKRQRKKIACLLESVIFHKVGSSINRNKTLNYGVLHINFLNRFIDMKLFYNNLIVWHLWRLIYNIYIFYLLKINYKMEFHKIFKFINILNRKSNIMNNVSEDYFKEAIQEFNKKIS